jgi:signal peptidase I
MVFLANRGNKFVLESSVMAPTIRQGEVAIVKAFRPGADTIRRYDIVAFHSPIIPRGKSVMRVVGLPGEVVALTTNAIFINKREIQQQQMPSSLRQKAWLTPQLLRFNPPRQWTLARDEVFVVGDNLEDSNDSRYWGPLKESMIIGVVRKIRPRLRIGIP